MNDPKDGKFDDAAPKGEGLLAFPHSRSRPPGSTATFKDLGVSKAAQAMGKVQPNLKGHWCSRCKGIWWGYVGECECPVCGNRNG